MFQIPPSEEDSDSKHTKAACPFCSTMISSVAVDCNQCLNILPLCIYTGTFVTADDFSFCPKCNFAAKFSEIRKSEDPCPMCNGSFNSQELEQLKNIQSYLDGFLNQFKHSKS